MINEKKVTTPRAKRPTAVCPACSSTVAAGKLDQSMLSGTATEADIDALRVQRRARMAGDVEAKVAARRLVAAVEETADKPTAGDDTCPGCGSTDVAVNERRLSPLGRRALAKARGEATGDAVDRMRAARPRSAASRADVEEHNERAARERAALRSGQ